MNTVAQHPTRATRRTAQPPGGTPARKPWGKHVTTPHTCGVRAENAPKSPGAYHDINAACERWLRDHGHITKFDNNILFGQRGPRNHEDL